MSESVDRTKLLLSLQRALLGAVHPQLRQASIEADLDRQVVRVRFEYDGKPSDDVLDSCQVAGTEVIADFDSWNIDEQHREVPVPTKLSPLKYVAYARYEQDI